MSAAIDNTIMKTRLPNARMSEFVSPPSICVSFLLPMVNFVPAYLSFKFRKLKFALYIVI